MWPLSLSLSLCHLGNIPELGMQAPFCITVSSALSFDSDDESSSQPSLSLLFSDIEEIYYLAM